MVIEYRSHLAENDDSERLPFGYLAQVGDLPLMPLDSLLPRYIP